MAIAPASRNTDSGVPPHRNAIVFNEWLRFNANSCQL
jgi:hypothetical protein